MSIHSISFTGSRQALPETITTQDDLLQLQESFVVSAAARGVGEKQKIQLDDKLVELVFDDNTTWLCHADTIEEVFPEAANPTRSADGAFELPQVLRSTGAERGLVSDIALKAVNLFAKKAIQRTVGQLAGDLEKKQLNDRIGLYRLDEDFNLVAPDFSKPGNPFLLFIHGTSSSTSGSFGKLAGTEAWKDLVRQYGQNILALQHETLTLSPLQNVEVLVHKLPAGITLHLVTHSRGGLVGDILSRYCNSNAALRGFDENEVAYLKEEGRDKDVEIISRLAGLFQQKNLSIARFVRVACPANGTILASRRMDNFFNVTANLVGLGTGIAASPVYGAFRNLIAAVIDTKNNTEALPGIEAMNPDSPFIKVMNTPASSIEIDDPLVVISGNCKAGINLKGLLVIASKLFYFTDNDLVVNTKSMYQGSKRHCKLKYLFDEAGNVDHFHYFQNEKTRNALLLALKGDGDLSAAGFKTEEQAIVIEQARNIELLGLEGGDLVQTPASGTRPIAVLLPGIMGSNLSLKNDKIWIDYKDFLFGGLGKLAISEKGIAASSIVKTSYGRLAAYLNTTYDVVVFPYDWRQPLTESAKEFEKLVTKLLELNQPIKIIGHSMGGVLVRDFILRHNETWKRLNAAAGFRLIFLGAPLGGSYRIPAVLFGKDAIIDKLSMIDIVHTKKQLLGIFSRFPGLLSLLPLATGLDNDFAKELTWSRMAEATGDSAWPLPVDKGQDLDWFFDYREKNKETNDIDFTNVVYIAGKDKATPCGYRIDQTARGPELVFLSTGEGDQSVTWETGIPKKLIDNDSVYYVNVTHGSLGNAPQIFDGIAEILAKGKTSLLSKARPVVRGEEKVFKSPELRDLDLTETGVEKTLLGLEPQEEKAREERPVDVVVSHGDLNFALYPVLAGHFLNDGILYAEATIDKMLDGALTERHRLGIYPGDIGTSKVHFLENGKGAIIVGLGKFGLLTSSLLTQTVEQGIANYLIEVNKKQASDAARVLKAVDKGVDMFLAGRTDGLLPDETNREAARQEKELNAFKKSLTESLRSGQPQKLGVSALVIASGYGGLSIENSMSAVIQGVQNANARIADLHRGRYSLVEYIEFIELYEDRALSCFYSLSKMAKSGAGGPSVRIAKKEIRRTFGAKRRIPAEMSEGWWNRITVRADEKSLESKVRHQLCFTASTLGAREESRNLFINPAALQDTIRQSSDSNLWSPRLGKTLFEMLLPLDFKEQFKRRFNINWILDPYTAAFPWELLQDTASEAKPLCVNAGMVRQMVTRDFRLNINAVAANNALVVAEPQLNGFLPALPGALREGTKVTEWLEKNGLQVNALLQETAGKILPALFANDYKIIHLAGHGTFNKDEPESSGMVIGENSFLTTAEIQNMSTVPELVFVNCCFLGRTDPEAEEFYRNTYRLAANIGTQLIDNGVKAVVVAGWAVNDEAALRFTEVFYQTMFGGECFGDAIRLARSAVYEEFHTVSNTWGAYQCYGDPFYKLRNGQDGKLRTDLEFVIAEQAEIALSNLQSESHTGYYSQATILKKLKEISDAVDAAQIRDAEITEKEALIYTSLSEYDKAIQKFESLLSMENANFSVKSLEQYSNVRMKKYVADYLKASQDNKKPGAEERKAWVTEADKVISGLESLLLISPTVERYNLLGSAYKRKGILVATAAEKKKAYSMAAYYYQKAHAQEGKKYTSYALTNWYELESILALTGDRKWKSEVKVDGKESYELPAKTAVQSQVKKLMDDAKKSRDQSDNYWSLVVDPNCRLCLQMVNNPGAKDGWDKLETSYRDVWSRAGSKGDKFAELEHLQLLADALSIGKEKANGLKEHLETLKNSLEKIL